jgi:hypothetical protein
MVDEGFTVPGAHCDSCNIQGLTLYPRYRDGNRWLCKRCVNEKKFSGNLLINGNERLNNNAKAAPYLGNA